MRYFTFSFIAFILCSFFVVAQEYTLPLFTNINYHTYQSPYIYHKNSLPFAKTAASLSLPFFDDFNYADRQTYPDMNRWEDSSVYVNFGYAKYPISFGVATFDGLNKKGLPYKNTVSSTASEPADTLTSRPINLSTSNPQDSVALVFYYQRMGNGDNPDAQDSLILDFYKPSQGVWNNKIWAVTGSNIAPVNDSTFQRVHIYIKDTAFFHDGFKFRFRNKATPVGSVDHWHLDYIKLDKYFYTTDTIIDDVAFYYMSTPLLKNYSAMPYNHFLPSEMATTITNYMKNNHETTTKNVNYQFDIYDRNWNFLYHYNGGSANVAPGINTVVVHQKPNFSYTIAPTDTTKFYVKHYLNTVPDVWNYNDTLIQCTPLMNYFAYDDGQAELGYYLKFYGSQVAVRYTLNVTDTLQAMDIFFIPVNSFNINGKDMFRICVWSSLGGQPSSLIYKDSLMAPKFLDWGYNQIPRYKLTKPLVLSPGTYFFGLQIFPPASQYSVTIGLDVNRDHSNSAYYNSTGTWQQSSVKGSLMIHPILGDRNKAVGVTEFMSKDNDDFIVYPNPINNQGYFNIHTQYQEAYDIKILNLLGQEILSKYKIQGSTIISTPDIPSGVYIIQFITKSSIINKKIIVK